MVNLLSRSGSRSEETLGYTKEGIVSWIESVSSHSRVPADSAFTSHLQSTRGRKRSSKIPISLSERLGRLPLCFCTY